MANYGIPEPVLPGFISLTNLSKSNFDAFVSALSKAQIGDGPKELREQIQQHAKIDDSTLISIITSIRSLLAIIPDDPADYEQFAADFTQSLNFAAKDLKAKQIKQFNERLLLTVNASESIKVSYKANQLFDETQNTFLNARIISDIRPIFNEKLNDFNRNALILHQLRVDFRENFEDKRIVFSLRGSNIDELIDLLQRAKEKEKLIRSQKTGKYKFIKQ